VLRALVVVAVSVTAIFVVLVAAVRWLEPRFAFFPSAGEDVTPRDFGVEFEPVSMSTRDGERLHGWWLRPPSPRATILYFHGNGGNLSNWAPILTTIVKRGYAVFAIEYRGYGLSTGRPTERGLYRDVDATLAHAWTSPASIPLIYWGRSLGGTMAAYAATVRRPDGLILESAFPDSRAVVRESPVLVALSLFATYRFPTAEFVNRTTMPVLQLHGDRDSVIPFAVGQDLFARIREPKTFVTIRGGDHNDVVPADPATYWNAIDGFVARSR